MKTNKTAELEGLFVSAGDDAFELANRFTRGELAEWSTDDIREELKLLKGVEGKREMGKVNLMYLFNQEYGRLTGIRHPNYEKYVNHINVVLSELEKELAQRMRAQEDYNHNLRISFSKLDETIRPKIREFVDLFKAENKRAFLALSYVKKGFYDNFSIQILDTIKKSFEAKLEKAKICDDFYTKFSDNKKSHPSYSGYAQKTMKIIEGLDKKIKQRGRNNLLKCLLRKN